MNSKLILLICVLVPCLMKAQVHCGAVSFEPNVPVAVNLTFDSFSQYEAGVTINNVATLRLRIEDQAIPDPDCKWFLHMEVDNNPGGGTPSDEWETLTTYGSGTGQKPILDILEIRVRNNCQTSPLDGVFQTFSNDGDILDIISDLLPLTPAGSCTTNVNGPGNHQGNYNEFTFSIDVRVRPGYDFNPGVYELNVRFHLEEQM